MTDIRKTSENRIDTVVTVIQIEVIQGAAAEQRCSDPAFISAWTMLLAQCPWATGFQSPGYICAWYGAYRSWMQPVLICGFDTTNRLTGLLALYRSHDGGLGNAGGEQAEYHTWICHLDDVATFGTAALRAAQRLIRDLSSLEFRYLPPTMPLDWLSDPDPSCRLTLAPRSNLGLFCPVTRPLMRLGNGEDVEKSLRKSSNKGKIKRLEKFGRLSIRRLTDRREFVDTLDQTIAAYDLRHTALHDIAPFGHDPAKREFHHRLIDAGNLMHATITTAGDTFVALYLGIITRREFQLGITVHNPWLSKHSPSKIHLLLLARLLLHEGYDTIDLTPGDDAYKQRSANDHDTVHKLSVYAGESGFSLGQFKCCTRETARAFLKNRDWSTADAKNLVKQCVTLARPGKWLPVVRQTRTRLLSTISSAVYRIDPTTLRSALNRNTPHLHNAPCVQRDDQAALLLGQLPPPHLTMRQLASMALNRFEAGMHLYSITEQQTLCSLGWFASRPDEALAQTLLPDFALPPDSAVICDVHTFEAHRRRGHARAIISAMLHDAADDTAIQNIFFIAPANNPATSALAQDIGATLTATIHTTVRLGKTKHHTAGIQA